VIQKLKNGGHIQDHVRLVHLIHHLLSCIIQTVTHVESATLMIHLFWYIQSIAYNVSVLFLLFFSNIFQEPIQDSESGWANMEEIFHID